MIDVDVWGFVVNDLVRNIVIVYSIFGKVMREML